MYLKKLEILGFKSFAHKTVIDFSKGITAIVGPNGCGKTNILDALRWVLGEQKVSMLRGSKMEEVIFNGTRDAKPLGMSEVTLTLVNNRGVLPTEYTEVQITRRLFRSGESEYLMNKVPCRLKDIIELFYGTGVGAHSYSVIQQDMIESVISDKAEERRFLFEEAAGITKYKQRKKAAIRKLEATENDFLRLHDIYSEVQTQVRSLKRQQKKAERYQVLAEEIKNWDLFLSSSRIKQIELDKRSLKAEYDSKHDQVTASEAELDRLSSDMESERKDQIDLEQALSQIGNEIFDITEQAHTIEKEITILHEKKINAVNLIERNEKEIEAIKIRTQLLDEQSKEHTAALEEQRTTHNTLSEDLTEAASVQAEADRRLLQARSSKEQHNQKMIELEGKLSSGRTEEDNLKQQEEELSSNITQLESTLNENRTSRELAARLHQENTQRREIVVQRKTEAEQKYSEKSKLLEQKIEENENLSEEISSLNASIEAAQARRNLLEEMILQYEGYESGVKTAMEEKDRWPGILGTVAEKFTPVDGMEAAVEAALGEMARFLITENRTIAEQIIAHLKSENKGRIGILVRDSGTINAAVKRPDFQSDNFVGWMDQFVSTDESLRPLMEAVLARTAIFKNGSINNDILERLPYGFQAVTPGGELVSKNIITGGSDDTFPLFRRQEKVTEIDDAIQNYRNNLQQIKDKKNRLTAEIASLRAEINNLNDALESYAEELTEAQKAFSETEYQLKGIDTEVQRLERELKSNKDKLETIKNRQYSLGLNFNQLSSERATLIDSIAVSSEELSDLESNALKAAEKVSSLQIKLVETRSKIDHFESKISHVNELLHELEHTSQSKSDEIVTAKDDIEHAKDKTANLETALKELFDKRKETTEKQSVLRSRQNEIMERVNTKEKSLKEVRSRREALNNDLHQIDIKLNTFDSEARSLTEKITEEYDLDINTLEIESPDPELAREQAVKQLHELKEQLKKFGAVNLLALEEYRSASEREVFLKEQLDDLATAKDDLQTTINKINQTAKQLFEETLAKVRVNFKKLFTDLFTGGEADIYLKNPSDPLESDIEIYARPRGKKLVSITMMSGGERALTAISLLFSLYLVKPSPFCILDEIDAPLDDANCRRFLKIIDTFSNQTQFIMITHNKITMEASHNLYGVTMEQLGISKLVAVKFNEVEKDGSFVINQDVKTDDADTDTESINVETTESTPEAAEQIEEFSLDDEDEDSNGNGNGNGHGNKEHSAESNLSIPNSPDELPEKVIERLSEQVTGITEKDSNEQD